MVEYFDLFDIQYELWTDSHQYYVKDASAIELYNMLTDDLLNVNNLYVIQRMGGEENEMTPQRFMSLYDRGEL